MRGLLRQPGKLPFPIFRTEWLGSPLVQGALAFPVLFLLFALFNLRFVDFPYFWDGLGYVYPHAHDIHQANLFPILMRWDVGHPTLYFWLLAVVMKVAGIGPLAGKLLTWGFASLLVLGLYGCGRVLGLRRSIAAAAVIPVCAFPLFRVNFFLSNPDLALAALALTAWWAWVRGRPAVYLIAGCALVLTKIYGIFLLLPVILVALLLPLPYWKDRRAALDRAFLAAFPVLALIVFLMLRNAWRGGGLTVGWETGNQPIPFWRFREFIDYLPRALGELYTASMFGWVVLLAVLVAIVWAAAVPPRPGREWFAPPAAMSLLLILVTTPLLLTFFFVQSYSLTARYMMPAIPGVFLLVVRLLADLIPRRRALAGVLVGWALLLTLQAHPSRVELLPRFLHGLLKRPALVDNGWRLENDLRVLDTVPVYRALLGKIEKTAAERDVPPNLNVSWPFDVAAIDPDMGWTQRPWTTNRANAWEEINPHYFPFVVIIRPVAWYYDDPPEDTHKIELVGTAASGEVEGEVYLLTPRDREGEDP